jgi:two-component system response regulator AtoC
MQILVVDHDHAVRQMVGAVLRDDGFEVVEAADGESALALGRSKRFDLVFCDPEIGEGQVLRALKDELQPDADIILMTADGSQAFDLAAARSGAPGCIRKPFSVQDLSGLARTTVERRRHVRPVAVPDLGIDIADLIGQSPLMMEVFKTISRVARTDLPVLITGESGTGKEVIARTVHANSGRATRPFVSLNCAALTETLLERELFGYSRDGFGAPAGHQGLFELADGGTLLLDEVTEITPACQARLLRVLQDGEVRRLGSSATMPVDVRILATTNRDPGALVASGQLRDDLLFRLNVVSLRLPPLRDRTGDIDLMISAFMARHSSPSGAPTRMAPEAVERLKAYRWPGNVRELRHTVQRLAGEASGIIRVANLPERIRNAHGDLDELFHEMPGQDVVGPAWMSFGDAKGTDGDGGMGLGIGGADRTWLPLGEIERRYLVRVLYFTRGNKKRAAEILGVDRKTLSRMVERNAISVARIKRDVRGQR